MVKDKLRKAVEEKEETELEFEEVENLPPTTRKGTAGRYTKLVSEIAKKPKKGTFRVRLDKQNLSLKSVYPSIEVALQRLAKLNGVDFTQKVERTVKTAKGEKTYTSHPMFAEWKEKNLHIRVVNGELYLEKVTEKALKT